MAGILKPTTAPPAIAVVRPGPEAWEKWSIPAVLAEPESTAPEPDLWTNLPAIVAVPTRKMLSIPLWIPAEEDPHAVLQLELELRGASRAEAAGAFVWETVEKGESRSLVTAWVDSGALSAEPLFPRAVRYEPNARCLAVAADAVFFWKELGEWCVGFTRGGVVLLAQSLGSPNLGLPEAAEVSLLYRRLVVEGLVRENVRLLQWHAPATVTEAAHLRQVFPDWETQTADGAVSLPERELDLAPAPVQAARRRSSGRKRLVQIGIIAAAVYALFVLALIGRYAWGTYQIRQLEAAVALQRPGVEELQGVATRWGAMRQALDPSFFGIDLLYNCARLLPERDVRLTSFALAGARLQLNGEAQTVPLAFQYIDRVKKSSELSMFRWEAPQPTVLPNNSASFQIVGTRQDVQVARP